MIKGKMISHSDEKSREHVFFFTGKTVSVNKWLAGRVIKNHGKHVAILYKRPEYVRFVNSLAATFSKGKSFENRKVDCVVTVYLPERQDSDSIIKPILDAMELGGLIKNDKNVRDIQIVRGYHAHAETDCVIVRLRKAEKRVDDLEKIMSAVFDQQEALPEKPKESTEPLQQQTSELF